jgi:hypothetical protein
MPEPRYSVDSTTHVTTTDQLTKDERLRLEAFHCLTDLYVGSSRATLRVVFEYVDEVERYLRDGTKPTFAQT